MTKMCPVVHFEMPYEQRDRIAKFYESAFGWQLQMLGAEMGNYVIASTSEMDGCVPKSPGMINGGFYQKNPEWPAQFPSVVIAVDDIAAAMQQVSKAGGKVLGEPMPIPGVGQYVSFFDTEGNRVSMLQPLPRAA
jgi:uncharacterized protein